MRQNAYSCVKKCFRIWFLREREQVSREFQKTFGRSALPNIIEVDDFLNTIYENFEGVKFTDRTSVKFTGGKKSRLDSKDGQAYIGLLNKFLDDVASGRVKYSREQIEESAAEVSRFLMTKYIISSFAHTRNKDYENYVVLGIWHRLMSSGIMLRPVTQQFVKRTDGSGHKYALLDLYFPAINLSIECDEAHHKESANQVSDAQRESEILRRMRALDCETQHPEHVDATLPFEEIDKRLDEIVAQIRRLYNNLPKEKKLWDVRDPEEIVKKNGVLRVDDDVVFKYNCDFINALGIERGAGRTGGRYAKSLQRGGVSAPTAADGAAVHVWWPKIRPEDVEESAWVAKNGWNNLLKDEGREIVEIEKPDSRYSAQHLKDWLKAYESLKNGVPQRRIVFAHAQNAFGEVGYRFIGVFRLVRAEGDFSGAPIKCERMLYWRRIDGKDGDEIHPFRQQEDVYAMISE